METAEPIRNDPYAALRYAEFKHYLVTRFAIIFALAVQFVAVEWKVYELTKDPWSLGLIGLAEVIPSLSLALFAGHVVDKMEKRGMLLKCIAAYIAVGIGLFILTAASTLQHLTKSAAVHLIYALVFCGGIIRAFSGPSSFSLLPLLVPRQLYANAATWSSSAWQIGAVLGPALGGLLIKWIGVHGALLVVVFFFMIPLVSIWLIKPKPIHYKQLEESAYQSITKGLRFVFSSKAVLSALTLDLFAVLFGGAVALLPVFAQDILKVGATGFGIMRAAPAVGACLTLFILAYKPLHTKPGIKLLAAVFGFGIFIIIFGISRNFYLSVLALFTTGALDGVSVVIRQTILHLKTPDEMRGRVAAVNSMFIGSSNEIGAFESGLTARWMGTVPAVVFGGCMTLLVVITTYLVSPALRKLELK